MLKRMLCFSSLAVALAVPSLPAQVELANMREDLRGLIQRVGDLSLRVEQLERENAELRGKAGAAEKSYVTLTQLNDAIASINQTIRSSAAITKSETLQQVSVQMEKLAKQTNTAIDSLAKGMATRNTPRAMTPSETIRPMAVTRCLGIAHSPPSSAANSFEYTD